MGTASPTMSDLMPLVDCMERRMTASSSFLAQGGRLQYLNSALSSLLIFFLCILFIPPRILKKLQRIQRQYLWRKNRQEPAPSLAPWELICRPKNKGGLGIIDLGFQNVALLLKHVSKFLNKTDIPWVQLIWNSYYHNLVPQGRATCGSFWWKDILKLLDHFREVSWVEINEGDTALFWQDKCNVGDSVMPLQHRFPRLFSYVKDTLVLVKEVLNNSNLLSWFHLPLSGQANEELQALQNLLQSHDRQPDLKDVCSCHGTSKSFTPKQFHISRFINHTFNPILLWIWKSCCTMKIKVFAWMLIMDRLNTKDMVERRHWHIHDGVNCVLCPTHTREDRDHLFFNCNFSQRVWSFLQID